MVAHDAAWTSGRQVPSEEWQFEYEVKPCTGERGKLRPQKRCTEKHNFKT